MSDEVQILLVFTIEIIIYIFVGANTLKYLFILKKHGLYKDKEKSFSQFMRDTKIHMVLDNTVIEIILNFTLFLPAYLMLYLVKALCLIPKKSKEKVDE